MFFLCQIFGGRTKARTFDPLRMDQPGAAHGTPSTNTTGTAFDGSTVAFDRILLNGLIQPVPAAGTRGWLFQHTYRQLYPVSRHVLQDIADQFQRWLERVVGEALNIPVADAPKGRRDDFVDPYFKGADLDAVVIILKAREPARIMTAIGDSKANRWHLQIANRCGRPIQLLYQRPAMGTDVCPHLSPTCQFSRPRLPQSASLAGQPHA